MKPLRGAHGAQSPGEVRIIGGQWKRSKLQVPVRPGLRPTPDRVRETLFNWLGQDLHGWRCLDAFAGSGALGFEAASRGAAEVWLVEADAGLAAGLKANAQRLQAGQVQVRAGDALAVLRGAPPGVWDVVFLDPPFERDAAGGASLFEQALKAAVPLLRHDGWLYLEAPRPWSDEALAALGLQAHRRLKAGAVHAHLLVRLGPSGDNPTP